MTDSFPPGGGSPDSDSHGERPIPGSIRPPSAGTRPVPAILHPPAWPAGSGYAHGIVTEGRQIFVAGQIGWDPVSQLLVGGGIAAQTRRALANIVAVLAEAGAGPQHIVRLTWFITDRALYLRERTAIGHAYRDVLGRHYPPMSIVVVSALLEEGAQVEIEATAVVPPVHQPPNLPGAERHQP